MESIYKLRYYLSETEYHQEKNGKVLQLLNLIKERHGLDYEILPLRLKKLSNDSSYTDEANEKEIYERDFKPGVRTLKQRLGVSLRDGLRSNRGHYYIAGVVAILEYGQVGWYTCWKSTGRFKKYSEDGEIGFLNGVLEEGEKLLMESCPAIASSPSDILTDKFIYYGTIKGQFERGVKVGQALFEVKGATFDWRKEIDLVCHADNGETWVLEVKPKLNWEAFGQVIGYGYLYEKKNVTKVSKGIICNNVDLEILAICEEFEIAVFERKANIFEKASFSKR